MSFNSLPGSRTYGVLPCSCCLAVHQLPKAEVDSTTWNFYRPSPSLGSHHIVTTTRCHQLERISGGPQEHLLSLPKWHQDHPPPKISAPNHITHLGFTCVPSKPSKLAPRLSLGSYKYICFPFFLSLKGEFTQTDLCTLDPKVSIWIPSQDPLKFSIHSTEGKKANSEAQPFPPLFWSRQLMGCKRGCWASGWKWKPVPCAPCDVKLVEVAQRNESFHWTQGKEQAGCLSWTEAASV